jgi:hypothetical protein
MTLVSKPGITGGSTLSIPKTWDGTWFRGFIASQLKGADVRNAIGANGVIINGNLSTPFATISINPALLDFSSTNVGFFVTTLEPFPSSSKGVQIAQSGTIQALGNILLLAGNAYYNGTNYVALNTGGGGLVELGTNGLNVFTAPSVAAGSNFAFAETFAVNGTTSPTIQGWGPNVGALADMTPDTGSATLTGTGFSGTAPTCTLTWRRQGTQITVNIAGLSGTSNATTFTLSGIPAAIQAAVAQNSTVVTAEDNTVQTYAVIGVSSTGTWTINKIANGGAGNGLAAWTAAGTKGLLACSFTYELA